MSPLVERPILHGRDHEWGGSDPAGITIEDVGSGAIGGGGGIDFELLNSGNWLFVETLDDAGSPDSMGLDFRDHSSGGIQIQALSSSATFDLRCAGLTRIGSTGAPGLMLWAQAGPIASHLGNSPSAFQVWVPISSPPFEALALEIRADGSLHIPTGSPGWVADL